MKFKYFFIIILLLAGILQFNRIMDKGKYFSVKQEFTFEKKKIEWLQIGELIKSEEPSPFPALVQLEVYGTEA